MGEGGELLKNKEAPKTDPGQKAVDIITTAKKEEVNSAVDKNITIYKSKEFLEAVKCLQENKELIEKSNTLIKEITDNKDLFKDIVNFISFYNHTPQNGSSITIVNCPELKKNGRENISSSSVLDTNDAQKKEIIQAFMTFPKEILSTQIQEFNSKKNLTDQISEEKLQVVLAKSSEYQGYQSKIKNNESTIKATEDITSPIEENVDLTNYVEHQRVGKLIELPENEKTNVLHQMQSIKTMYESYVISDIRLQGVADATPVTSEGKNMIKTQFTKHLDLLKEKGFNISGLPTDYEDFGNRLVNNKKIDEKDKNNTDIVSNRGFAFTRAIMQISRMSKEQAKDISKSNLTLNIDMSKKRGDKETLGGIVFNGSGTRINENGGEKFSVPGREASEVLLETGLHFAIKIGDQIKTFRFEKKDAMNPDGSTNTIAMFGKLTDEGHTGGHGNEKTILDTGMEKTATKYGKADLGGPTFYINIPEGQNISPENTSTVEKIRQGDMKNSTDIPSAKELLSLYTSLGGSKNETEKFEKIYAR